MAERKIASKSDENYWKGSKQQRNKLLILTDQSIIRKCCFKFDKVAPKESHLSSTIVILGVKTHYLKVQSIIHVKIFNSTFHPKPIMAIFATPTSRPFKA